MADLVTFGEPLVRLSPPLGDRLETATAFDVHVGGPESNVAAVAAQLGVSSAWLTKLADSPLGRRVVRGVREHGVEPVVSWVDEGRVATRFHVPGGDPRGATTVDDRERTAMRTAGTDDLPVERLREADAFYTTGVTPALSTQVAETTVDLLEIASEAATATVFTLADDRAPWSAADAREALDEILPRVDVLVVSEPSAATVLGYDQEPASIGAQLVAEYGHETVVVTRGTHGAVAISGGEVREQPAIPAETHDPVGAADALVGGFLARRLQGGSIAEGLAWGAATEALKRTVAGDVAVVTPEAVESVLADA